MIGSEAYALDMSWVKSIQRIDRLQPASKMELEDIDLVGWLPDRGGDIPVLSLTGQLRRPTSSIGKGGLRRIIVLAAPASSESNVSYTFQSWALLVDQVSQVIQVPVAQIEPLPPLLTNPDFNFFEGIIKLTDSLILLLSPEWLRPGTMLPQDSPRTEAVQAVEQVRPDKPHPSPAHTAIGPNGSQNNLHEIDMKSMVGRIIIFPASALWGYPWRTSAVLARCLLMRG